MSRLFRTRSTNHTTFTRKDFYMNRSIRTSILALGLAATSVAGSQPALAASPAGAPQHRAHQTGRALMQTVTNFGYAVIKGPDARINGYATPDLLAKAPAHRLISLIGPAQYSPTAFHFTIDAYTGSRASVTVTWKSGALGLVNSTSWVYTAQGYKLSAMQYVRSTIDRGSLLGANNALAHGLTQGKNVNSFATTGLLLQAPDGQLSSIFGFHNPPRTWTVKVNQLTANAASVDVSFQFGQQTTDVRRLLWSYTAHGWKLSAILTAGLG